MRRNGEREERGTSQSLRLWERLIVVFADALGTAYGYALSRRAFGLRLATRLLGLKDVLRPSC